MARSSGSTVVRRRLGTALRGLREDANIRIEAAARELECSTAKVSRLENGLGPAKKLEVRALLDLYGVVDHEQRTRFEQWADRTKSAGWWEPDSDVVDDDLARYLALETESTHVRMYCTPVLPVLLQSSAYALAHVRDRNPGLSDDEVQRLAATRQARQRELLDPLGSIRLTAVLDEGAVHRRVGSPEIHSSALLWLADVLDEFAGAGRGDVEVRVLPFSAGTPGRALNPFIIFSPRERDLDPVTAVVEDITGLTFFESDKDVDAMVSTFDQLYARSLDSLGSRNLLRSQASPRAAQARSRHSYPTPGSARS